jgi:hypothetical protein
MLTKKTVAKEDVLRHVQPPDLPTLVQFWGHPPMTMARTFKLVAEVISMYLPVGLLKP